MPDATPAPQPDGQIPPLREDVATENTSTARDPAIPAAGLNRNPSDEPILERTALDERMAVDPVLAELVSRGFVPSIRHALIRDQLAADLKLLCEGQETNHGRIRGFLRQAISNILDRQVWTIEIAERGSSPIEPDSPEADNELLACEWAMRSFDYSRHAATAQIFLECLANGSYAAFPAGIRDTPAVRHLAKILITAALSESDVPGALAKELVRKAFLNRITAAVILKTAAAKPPDGGIDAAAERFVSSVYEELNPRL